MTNFNPPRPSDAEVVAGWAAEALRDGRYALGKALAAIAQQAADSDRSRRMVSVPWAGATRTELPVRDYPRLAPVPVPANGAGPTGNGDADLEAAAIGEQLARTAVIAVPDLSPAPVVPDVSPAPVVPDSARCVARVSRDGVADECHGVAYWAPGLAGEAAEWRHVDPAVDAHHTPEVNL